MATGFLFITAPEASYTDINLVLHHLRDWDFNEGELNFGLITSNSRLELESPEDFRCLNLSPPFLLTNPYNPWAGASLEDVEAFCLETQRPGPGQYLDPSNIVVVDSAGLRDATAIFAHQDSDQDGKRLQSYQKMRVPWDEVCSTWCNLGLGEVGLDEIAIAPEESDESTTGGESGWWEYMPHGSDYFHLGDEAQLKEAALQHLRDQGLVSDNRLFQSEQSHSSA